MNRERIVFLATLLLSASLMWSWYPIFPSYQPPEAIPAEASPSKVTDEQLEVTWPKFRSAAPTTLGRPPFAAIDIWVPPHPEPLGELPVLNQGRVIPSGSLAGVRSPKLLREGKGSR